MDFVNCSTSNIYDALCCSLILSLIPSILLPVHCRRSWSSCCSSSHLRRWSQNDGRRSLTSWGTGRLNRCLFWHLRHLPNVSKWIPQCLSAQAGQHMLLSLILFPQFCLLYRSPAECRSTSLNWQRQEFQSQDELQTCACTTKRSGSVPFFFFKGCLFLDQIRNAFYFHFFFLFRPRVRGSTTWTSTFTGHPPSSRRTSRPSTWRMRTSARALSADCRMAWPTIRSASSNRNKLHITRNEI